MDSMSFTEAIGTCFKKSFDFSGRARRREYWYFSLFRMLVGIPVFLLTQGNPKHPLYIVWSIITFFPMTAVSVRRLHDTGKSGFLYLIFLILAFGTVVLPNFMPHNRFYYRYMYNNTMFTVLSAIFMFVFSIVLLIFVCTDSEAGVNKYGDSPKYPNRPKTAGSTSSANSSSSAQNDTWKCSHCGCSNKLNCLWIL